MFIIKIIFELKLLIKQLLINLGILLIFKKVHLNDEIYENNTIT